MAASTLNFNVGVLGHIDSGKTSLAKALSTVASTASFDKNPQSKERGITLDLGFSSFCVDIPDQLKDGKLEKLQFTLVDCPGHASLIKTIIGGAQIIDLMMLVVDVTKGMQTQTAECLVIGEITCHKMIVVLNKMDLLPEQKRAAMVEKMKKRMQKTLENTKFSGCPIIAVAAKPGGPEGVDADAIGLNELMELLTTHSYIPQRQTSGHFTFAVDHCFSIRGQGTVMTGTVLTGTVAVNDTVEIAALKETRKVKSMQMFRKPVQKASQGDRVGICVTQFDPKQLERGLVSTPGFVPTLCSAIISVHKITYYKAAINTKAKFHITIGHETVMARVSFFGYYGDDLSSSLDEFDYSKEYLYQDDLLPDTPTKASADDVVFKGPRLQFALIEFEKPVTCMSNSHVIAAKLDIDIHTSTCRLAFHGLMLDALTDPSYVTSILPRLRVYKTKQKQGTVERKSDETTVICRGLFKKETNMEAFVGLKVKLSTGEDGVIESGFGQSGKFKVRIHSGLSEEATQALGTSKAKKGKSKVASSQTTTETAREPSQTTILVLLTFKRYVYDPKKQMIQT